MYSYILYIYYHGVRRFQFVPEIGCIEAAESRGGGGEPEGAANC